MQAFQRIPRNLLRHGAARNVSSSATVVPVIDLGPARRGGEEDKRDVARQIADACEHTGFMSIVNHGIPNDVVNGIWQSTREFFDLPEEEKVASAKMTEEYPYGYVPVGGEVLARGKDEARGGAKPAAADLKESFSVGPSNPAAGMPPIQWPARPTSFRPTYEAYYREMEMLTEDMLGLFARALGLDPAWFEDKIDRHRSVIRSLNYPDIDATPEPGQLRASAHTDYGTMTILRQDDAPGGLQVLDKQGEWVDVFTPPDAFVVNIGDLMARWTNDRWVSTMHRVRLPEPDQFGSCRRQSIAFFHNINADHLVETIPTCITTDNPAKYEPVTAFDLLMQKHRASVGAQIGKE